MTYLLTATGLSPGGSTHLHANNTQNNTNNNRTTQITNVEECGPCPVFASFTLAFALKLRKKKWTGNCSLQCTVEPNAAENAWTCNVHVDTSNSATFTIRLYSSTQEMALTQNDVGKLSNGWYRKKQWNDSTRSSAWWNRTVSLHRRESTDRPAAQTRKYSPSCIAVYANNRC
jgi:hypothetical protein